MSLVPGSSVYSMMLLVVLKWRKLAEQAVTVLRANENPNCQIDSTLRGGGKSDLMGGRCHPMPPYLAPPLIWKAQ